jgi:hypothetical protein
LRGKVAACGEDKGTWIMAMIFHLITVPAALALGVILGRMWEIRKELRRNVQRPHETGFSIPTARLWQP